MVLLFGNEYSQCFLEYLNFWLMSRNANLLLKTLSKSGILLQRDGKIEKMPKLLLFVVSLMEMYQYPSFLRIPFRQLFDGFFEQLSTRAPSGAHRSSGEVAAAEMIIRGKEKMKLDGHLEKGGAALTTCYNLAQSSIKSDHLLLLRFPYLPSSIFSLLSKFFLT